MSLSTYLEEVRGRSDQAKSRLAFTYAVIFTAIIFIIWLSALSISVTSLSRTPAPVETPALSTPLVASAPLTPSESWTTRVSSLASDFIDSVARGVTIALARFH
jgi:hypothetical protein